MKKPVCIIFDLDGTLIDSSDGVVEAFNYSLKMMGQPELEADIVKRYIGYPLSQVYPKFTKAPLSELYRHFQTKAAKTVVASTVAFEGVPELLTYLSGEGYRLAIASTKIQLHIDKIIKKLGWDDIIETGIGGDQVENVKPAPDMFHFALQRMKVTPEQSIVVGDTINDVLAAQAVPMRVVAVTSPYGGEEELRASHPDFYIERITDLKTTLSVIDQDEGGEAA